MTLVDLGNKRKKRLREQRGERDRERVLGVRKGRKGSYGLRKERQKRKSQRETSGSGKKKKEEENKR